MVVVYTLVTYSMHQWTDSDDLYVIRRVHQPPGVALIVRDWRVQGFYPLISTNRKLSLRIAFLSVRANRYRHIKTSYHLGFAQRPATHVPEVH